MSLKGDAASLLAPAALPQTAGEHPVPLVFRARTAVDGVRPSEERKLRALPGRDVSAELEGQTIMPASRQLTRVRHRHGGLDGCGVGVRDAGTDGVVVGGVRTEAQTLGLLAFDDTPRPTAKAAIDLLRRLGVRTVMLTGDGAGAPRAVAGPLGIDEVAAEVLPNEAMPS